MCVFVIDWGLFRDEILHVLVVTKVFFFDSVSTTYCHRHVYAPKQPELLPCDWLLVLTSDWILVPNKVTGLWSPYSSDTVAAFPLKVSENKSDNHLSSDAWVFFPMSWVITSFLKHKSFSTKSFFFFNPFRKISKIYFLDTDFGEFQSLLFVSMENAYHLMMIQFYVFL